MKRTREIFLQLIELLAVVGIFAMMLHVTVNALTRTLFSTPLFGTMELTSYWYLPLVASLGFVAAQLRREHIKADLVFEAMPRLAQVITFVVVTVVCAVASALLFYFGMQEALHAQSIGVTAGNTEFQTWFLQVITALAFLFLAGNYVVQTVTVIRRGEVLDDDAGDLIREADNVNKRSDAREVL